jgi:type IV secretion system protein VirB10
MIRLIACAALAGGLAAQPLEIPKGAHVLLRMVNSVSTRTAREGDFVYLQTASPVAAGGQIVLPAGSYVQGVVARTKRSGRVAGRAELAIRLETLTLPAGKVVKFSPKVASVDAGDSGQRVEGQEGRVQQAPGRGQDAGQVAILAGSGAALGGMVDRGWRGAGIGAGAGAGVGLARVLLSRGKEVELRHGASLDVVFDRVVVLE